MMDDGDSASRATVGDGGDTVDVTLPAEIKEELLDDADFDIADVNNDSSDIEAEDDGDVIIVDAEKTMQYLSGIKCLLPCDSI